MEYIENVIENLIGIHDSIIRHVRQYRGSQFHVSHWEEITQLKENTPYRVGISKSMIEMYRKAARFQYEFVSSMTDTIFPHDEPWLENLQAPVVIQLLKEQDPAFQKAVDDLIEVIRWDKDHAVERTAMARYTGQFGPTWIFGDRAVWGTQKKLYRTLLDRVPADDNIKAAIATNRVTTYANLVGLAFSQAMQSGASLEEAVQLEKETLIHQWQSPMDAQVQLMQELDFHSFDVELYMLKLKSLLEWYIKPMSAEGNSYRNIIFVPTLIGDVHHVSQMMYNFCKDDMSMAILETVARCLEKTLQVNIATFTSLNQIPIFEITATASAYILGLDGFTSEDVEFLLQRRHRRLITRDPVSYQREDMNELFVSYIRTGERVLESNPQKPSIGNFAVDLSPIMTDSTLQDPASYTWGQLPITIRFAAMLKFVDEPFMLITDPGSAPIWIGNSADPQHESNCFPYGRPQ